MGKELKDFKNFAFKKITKEDLESILKIRNQEEVRKASINNKIITWDDHVKWFNKKNMTNFFHHYCLKHNNKFIGVGYGENFDEKNNSCLWGLYRDLTIKSNLKYGSIILYLTFENLFSLKKIKSVRCQVLKEFDWIKDWYIRWGHEIENFDDKEKCFNLFLKKEKWNEIKNEIYNNLNLKING